MTEAFQPASEKYLRQIITVTHNLNAQGAIDIVNNGLQIASELDLYGFMTVFSREGMMLNGQAFGELARPAHMEIAMAKATTVLRMRRSTRLLAEWLTSERPGLSPDQFAGQIPTTLGGGVAIFADEERKHFIGAAAFSGGSPEQDEWVCVRGLYRTGLYADITPAESQQLLQPKDS